MTRALPDPSLLAARAAARNVPTAGAAGGFDVYLDRSENAVGMRQVSIRIAEFRYGMTTRIPRAYPHRLS